MPARPRSFVAVVKAAERALRARRIDHVFVGGVAVLAFGEPRTTRDVDVIASYRSQDVDPLTAEFRHEGFLASAADLRDALSDRTHCSLDDTRSSYRVDLAPATTPATEHAIEDRRIVRWRGMLLPIAAPEHTVVMKLRYGSEQDVLDALGILVRQHGQLDVRRMREFALQQRVVEALRDLERQAESLGGSRR